MITLRPAVSQRPRLGHMPAPEPPMSDVHAWLFRSAINVDKALGAVNGAPGFTFSVRDSEDDGRYVNGTLENGVRVCLRGEKSVSELEVYFPGAARGGPLSEAERARVVDQVVPDLLKRIGARDVERERE